LKKKFRLSLPLLIVWFAEALRIHISTASHDALRYFNVFEMEPRGEMNIKGKGLMKTFWLLKKNPGVTKKQMFSPDV
jgi:hypothetical protein